MVKAAQICSSVVFLFAMLVGGALALRIVNSLSGGQFALVAGPLAGLAGVSAFIAPPTLAALIALGNRNVISKAMSIALFMNKASFVVCFVWPFGPAAFVKLMQIPQVQTYFGICFLTFILNALALEKRKKLPALPHHRPDAVRSKEQINRVAEEGDLAFKNKWPKSNNPYLLPSAKGEDLELAGYWDRGYQSAERKALVKRRSTP